MLKNAAVKAEVQRLNKEEFAIFDETLKARKVAGLSQQRLPEESVLKDLLSLG